MTTDTTNEKKGAHPDVEEAVKQAEAKVREQKGESTENTESPPEPEMSPSKPITINLGGEDRLLHFGMANLCIMEEELDLSLPQAISDLSSGKVSLKVLMDLLWAGLLQFDDEGVPKKDNLSRQKIRMLADPAYVVEYTTRLGEAINGAFARPSKNAKRPNRKSGAGNAS